MQTSLSERQNSTDITKPHRSKHEFPFHVSDNLFAIILLLPVFAILLTVVFLPIVKGIYTSFCTYKLSNLDAPVWNNFENYLKVFKDGAILIYFKNTLIYVGVLLILQFVLGLAIALLINMKIRGRGIIRGLILIPWVIPSVVAAIVWSWMLHQQFGVLNYILYNLGIISNMNTAWIQIPNLAMTAVILAALWKELPYMVVMLLAGLQSVDISLTESAKVEGANSWQVLRYITLPSIRPVINTTLWISLMQNIQMFTIIYNMTAGGPINSTTVLAIAAYKKAFLEYDFGAGSAIGVIWLVVLLIGALIYNRYNSKYETDYQ